ncbi:MAG TPA: class I SAM-dependent methyltransferase [Chitinophagaceae bacterium]|nr:class I SAM-dependent methyltransferase [Chitinophagaceae bacterium]
MAKDFSTISPSAVSLLMLKSLSNIPYACSAATYMFGTGAVQQFKNSAQFNRVSAARLFHFENRYATVDEALQKTGISNIIEISSGFSFRGLEMCKQAGVNYIDTDLPGIITIKEDVIQHIENSLPFGYLLKALNVLDEDAFFSAASQLPAGPLAIINEGLLVYLNAEEKAMLCSIIHKILQQKDGCWITGDIYIRHKNENAFFDERTRQFFEAHNVEENKFAGFEAAENFFNTHGFKIAERLVRSKTFYAQQDNAPHYRETWVLKPVN